MEKEMTGADRRKKLIFLMRESEQPLSGTQLGQVTGVSRQVVVGDVALLRAAPADTGVTDITQKGQTLLLSLGQRMDVPSLMAVCTLPAYRSRLLLSAGEHPKLTLHLKPGEEALAAAGHLVEALTLKRKEISGETPAEGGTL